MQKFKPKYTLLISYICGTLPLLKKIFQTSRLFGCINLTQIPLYNNILSSINQFFPLFYGTLTKYIYYYSKREFISKFNGLFIYFLISNPNMLPLYLINLKIY